MSTETKIQRYEALVIGEDRYIKLVASDCGDLVEYADHLAAVEEAREAALKEAAKVCESIPGTQDVWLPSVDNSEELVKAYPRMTNGRDCADAIRALRPAEKGEKA